jgi:hypothetical protein
MLVNPKNEILLGADGIEALLFTQLPQLLHSQSIELLLYVHRGVLSRHRKHLLRQPTH